MTDLRPLPQPFPVQGKEYCVFCRRQHRNYIDHYFDEKVKSYKRWFEQRLNKENKDEEKRIEHVKRVNEVRDWCTLCSATPLGRSDVRVVNGAVQGVCVCVSVRWRVRVFVQIYNSAREINRRARMTPADKRRDRKRLETFMNTAKIAREGFEAHRREVMRVRASLTPH